MKSELAEVVSDTVKDAEADRLPRIVDISVDDIEAAREMVATSVVDTSADGIVDIETTTGAVSVTVHDGEDDNELLARTVKETNADAARDVEVFTKAVSDAVNAGEAD